LSDIINQLKQEIEDNKLAYKKEMSAVFEKLTKANAVISEKNSKLSLQDTAMQQIRNESSTYLSK